MKKLILLLALLLTSTSLYAQSFEEYKRQARDEYKNYKSEQEKEYAEFREKVNQEFAAFMRGEWEPTKIEPAMPLPEEIDPPTPEPANPDDAPVRREEARFGDIVIPSPIVEQPRPSVPIPDYRPVRPIIEDDEDDQYDIAPPRARPNLDVDVPQQDLAIDEMPELSVNRDTPQRREEPQIEPTPEESSRYPVGAFHFDYYGADCSVSLEPQDRFALSGTDENAVADGWLKLSDEKYYNLLNDCLDWRDALRLSDWGYFRFVEKMTEAFFGQNSINEARLMQMYILTQSGYKVRMARTGSKIVLIIPIDADVCKYNYFEISGLKYYVIDTTVASNAQYYIFNREFPNEQNFSLLFKDETIYAENNNVVVSRSFSGFTQNPLSITINGNLLNFYSEFPCVNDWNLYARASLSTKVKDVLYPQLRAAIAGKSETEAANILLSFAQNAFNYKTDEEQFGYERSLFADETMFFSYSDCEDRAILYSTLVKDFLNLDAVLVHYEGHLATAVRFSSQVNGDYFTLDRGIYTVCDPTYMGATIGMSMPQFKGVSATIIYVY